MESSFVRVPSSKKMREQSCTIVIKILDVSQVTLTYFPPVFACRTSLQIRFSKLIAIDRSFLSRGRNATSSLLSVARLQAIPRRKAKRVTFTVRSRNRFVCIPDDRFASLNIFHAFLSIPWLVPSTRRLFAVSRVAEKCEWRNRQTLAVSESCNDRLKINIFPYTPPPYTLFPFYSLNMQFRQTSGIKSQKI